MFARAARFSLVTTLSFGLAFPPMAAAEAALRLESVTPDLALQANRNAADPEATLARLLPGVPREERATTLLGRARSVGASVGRIGEEIISLQAIIVMTAALGFQARREHREREALANGRPITENSESWTAMFGSGEFFLGALGTAGALAATKLSGGIMKALLKSTGQRVPFVGVLGAIASQSTLMTVGTAASFTWTEGVKALSSLEDMKRAEGIAGRAFAASTNWATFSASEDGRVFREILKNMQNILIVDHDARETWIYNTYRFGLARGEFLASVGALMSASAAAQLAVGAFTTGPITGAVATTILGGALGFGAMTALFGAELPQKLTKLIQNARAASNKSDLKNARKEIEWYSQYLTFRQRPSHQPSQVAYWNTLISTSIGRINVARENYANVMIERFYELLLETKKLEGNIALAEEALKDPRLSRAIYFEKDGQIVSFEKAREMGCGTKTCDLPGAYQLQALDKYRPILKEANDTLIKIGFKVINAYDQDERYARNLIAGDATYDIVGALAETLTTHMNRSALLALNLRYVLGGAHKPLGEALGQPLTDNQRLEFTKDLGGYYTHVYSEKMVYAEYATILKAQSDAR